MKKKLLTLFILIVALPTVWATNIYYEITQEKSVSQIQNEINAIIETSSQGDTITVTGSKTDADATLTLSYGYSRVYFIWQAIYKSNSSFTADNLIRLSGNSFPLMGSTFELADGALITENANAINASGTNTLVMVSGEGKIATSGDGYSAILTDWDVDIKDNAQLTITTGEVITSNGNKAVITVSSGTLTATSGNAIVAFGNETRIYISGGYLSNDADNRYPVVVIPNSNVLPFAVIEVSGNAIIQAKGMGCGIISDTDVHIKGNAQVISNDAGSDNFSASVRVRKSIQVSGNAKVTAREGYAILCNGYVSVFDSAKVEAKENAIAIFMGSGYTQISTVSVMGKAQVTAENNFAIAHNKQNTIFSLYNGAVFAYGKDISDVTVFTSLDTGYYTSGGVVLAWDKEAGNTNYEMFSTEDIYVFPESATAYWDKKDGKYGISYANRENTGFIPLDVIVLSINENKPLSNLKVYPNPTTGVIYISSEQADEWTSGQVDEIFDVYDIFGRKQKAESRKGKFPSNSLEGWTRSGRGGEEGWQPQADGVVMDISHLPAGIYFVKITTTAGEVVKKVVKE